MAYKIYHSQRFDRELSKFDFSFREQINKIEEQLFENPYVRDSLGTKWLREKRIGVFRIYYLIYEDLKSVFMVAVSGKKDQQKVIHTIRLILSLLREEIENIFRKDDSI